MSKKHWNDIAITSADKGGKVVVTDRSTYIDQCQRQLDDPEYYKKVEIDPSQKVTDEIRSEVSEMLKQKLISKKDSLLLTEDLDEPRMSIFYGLPKIHKNFKHFPPLRPIVSGFNSCTSKLSEYLDTFLKYQARKGASYIRDTKDFLSKLKQLKSIPSNSILGDNGCQFALYKYRP